jgi:hypothetical protein
MRYKLRVTLTVTGLLSSFALHAQDKLHPFSADVTYEANGEKQTGKIYSDGHSVRVESPGHLPNQEDVTFVRLDSGLAQSLIPQMHSYSEYPYGAPEDAQFIRYLPGAKVESKSLGTERLDRQNCDKVSVTVIYNDQAYSSTEWRSVKLNGFVVKSRAADGQWSAEYTNIRLGAQSASLFLVPERYARLTYSQDWTAALRQIKFAEELSDQIAIAKRAGLRIFRDELLSLPEDNPSMAGVGFIDPIRSTSIVGPTIDVDSGLPGLPAPSLRLPESGKVFDQPTRKVTLKWNSVPGAVTYYLQVVILPVDGKETGYGAMDKGLNYIQQSTKETTFAFDLDRARPGRWRVRAVDSRGSLGRPSAWSVFEFAP